MFSLLRPTTRTARTTFSRFSSTSAPAAGAGVPATPLKDTAVIKPEITSNLPQAGVISGSPDELHRRPVRIFRPVPSTTQSAKATSHHWRIDWDILQGGGKWENPLMGWASSADYMQGTHVKFNTKEAAIHFCEKQGYSYFVQEPQKQKFKAKNYSGNYAYTSKPLRQVVTK